MQARTVGDLLVTKVLEPEEAVECGIARYLIGATEFARAAGGQGRPTSAAVRAFIDFMREHACA